MATNVLILQPGFPFEVPFYVRGFKRMGACVLGVGDQPAGALSDVAQEGLDAYLQVADLWHGPSLVADLRRWDLPVKLDRAECLWEATMELTAELREAFRLPGMWSEHAAFFRDKNLMRRALEAAGIRNPRYARAATWQEVRAGAERVGFPLVIKPVAGAGSARTYRVDSQAELEQLKPAFASTDEVAIEEFVRGDEYTFETICAGGRILFENVIRYTPTMLRSRSEESISPQNMILRDIDTPGCRAGRQLGRQVLEALKFDTGITHMEWYLTADGEAVFGEIAARPPGGLTGEVINYSCDFDIYNALAEAVLAGRISQQTSKKYNVAIIFKRAIGHGRIRRIEGLDEIYREFGSHIVRHDLLPVGAPRRDWKQTLLSDGFVILRHPDLATATAMSQHVADRLKLYAG